MEPWHELWTWEEEETNTMSCGLVDFTIGRLLQLSIYLYGSIRINNKNYN